VAFHSLREYAVGDDLRLVHWKSTARTGRLLVRHEVVPDQSGYVVLLDTAPSGDFEAAVRIAASLCAAAARAGHAIRLRTTGHDADAAIGGAGRAGVDATAVLDALAAVVPHRGDTAIPTDLADGMLDGAALAVVTPGLSDAGRRALARSRTTFAHTYLVEVTGSVLRPDGLPAGITWICAPDAPAFARAWQHATGGTR
jgi:uncharacterized protein (DUF58 family)